MLVLSRRVGEAIVVGGNVRILVLSITGNSVRFGVEAPRSISVHREEVIRHSQADEAATPAQAPARNGQPRGA